MNYAVCACAGVCLCVCVCVYTKIGTFGIHIASYRIVIINTYKLVSNLQVFLKFSYTLKVTLISALQKGINLVPCHNGNSSLAIVFLNYKDCQCWE